MLTTSATTARILFGCMPNVSMCRVAAVGAIVIAFDVVTVSPAIIPILESFVRIRRVHALLSVRNSTS